MEQWEYWVVEIQETPDRINVMKEALAEGGRYGYELVAVTPITSSAWDDRSISLGGPGSSTWRVITPVVILTFKRRVSAQAAVSPAG